MYIFYIVFFLYDCSCFIFQQIILSHRRIISSSETGLNNADSRPKLVVGSPEGFPGTIDGKLREARMNHPKGFIVDDKGNIYVADAMNMAIRKNSTCGATRCAGLWFRYTWFCCFFWLFWPIGVNRVNNLSRFWWRFIVCFS
jgi:hypothetical protein